MRIQGPIHFLCSAQVRACGAGTAKYSAHTFALWLHCKPGPHPHQGHALGPTHMQLVVAHQAPPTRAAWPHAFQNTCSPVRAASAHSRAAPARPAAR